MPHVSGVALEGGVCAGKSTISRELLKLNPNLLCIPEYMEVLSDSDRSSAFGSVPDKTIDLFVAAETIRQTPVSDAKKLICADRSILSLIAYRYACRIVGIISQNDLSYAAQRIRQSDWIIPTTFVYLDVSHSTRLLRSARRDGKNSLPYPLLDQDFCAAFRRFFYEARELASIHFVQNEDEVEPGEVAQRVSSLLDVRFTHNARHLIDRALALMCG